jgi:hypothetical protein
MKANPRTSLHSISDPIAKIQFLEADIKRRAGLPVFQPGVTIQQMPRTGNHWMRYTFAHIQIELGIWGCRSFCQWKNIEEMRACRSKEVIYFFRDPRAVAASYWNLRTQRKIPRTLRHKPLTAESWKRQISRFCARYNYLAGRSRQNIRTLVVFFEDMVDNPPETFSRMFAFMRLSSVVTTGHIDDALLVTTFENLKAHDIAFNLPIIAGRNRLDPKDDRTHHYRDGTAGVHESMTTPEDRAWADEFINKTLDPMFSRYYAR